jgi:hypothetical protein
MTLFYPNSILTEILLPFDEDKFKDVINIDNVPVFIHLDSYYDSDNYTLAIVTPMKKYLKDWVRFHYEMVFGEKFDWRMQSKVNQAIDSIPVIRPANGTLPKQMNGIDCGLFGFKYLSIILDYPFPRSTRDTIQNRFIDYFQRYFWCGSKFKYFLKYNWN